MFEAVFNPIEVYLLICLAAAAGFVAGMDSAEDPYGEDAEGPE